MIYDDLRMPGSLIVWAEPDLDDGDLRMRLRLTYDGPLPAREASAKDKHQMRRHFAEQMQRFWAVHPTLSKKYYGAPSTKDFPIPEELREIIGREYAQFGYKFVPLVRKRGNIECSIHILLLRTDPPGSIVKSGDLDNRVKTILDALRKPDTESEMAGDTGNGDYFYCLLEDDDLITGLSVEVDTLLEVTPQHPKSAARLVITAQLAAAIDPSVRIPPETYFVA